MSPENKNSSDVAVRSVNNKTPSIFKPTIINENNNIVESTKT